MYEIGSKNRLRVGEDWRGLERKGDEG